jgi:hypothetical protein
VITASRPRRALRVGAVAVPAASLLLASPAVAAPPTSWNDPAPMSLLHALLVFGGIPLALMAGITLLVMAPSLIRGDRQQRGVSSWTEPQWFGGPADAVPAGPVARGEIEGGHESEPARETESAGGASARW